ncbi:acyltransferase family protein [Caballeronia hypogeia]|uniref:acyltransferase family protein n=1 Tax=Caballeronia hypogeia TaxID=1777140 RepID=UPI0012FE6741|nr:hypothetical protein [Caballeronia hypogeia]
MLGPLLTTLPADQYFSDTQTWEYFRVLKLTMRYELPGVFADNPFPRAVNGSLWSLPFEFHWYLILRGLGVVRLVRVRPLLALCAVAFAAYVFEIKDVQHKPGVSVGLEYGTFFCYGLCLYYFRDLWAIRKRVILAVAGIAAMALYASGREYAALFLILPPAVIFFGSASSPFIRHAGRFGDFSYGIYIYAFPVQQTLVCLCGNHWSYGMQLAASTLITFALAFLSWHLIEGPALRLKLRVDQPAQEAMPLKAVV